MESSQHRCVCVGGRAEEGDQNGGQRPLIPSMNMDLLKAAAVGLR